MAEAVYVHGLWMPGDESLILRYRLAHEFGLTLHPFRYSGASASMLAIAERLDQFVRGLKAPVVHFVGHSLGGLVIHRFLERFPEQPEGRVVFLGTPCGSSRAALSAVRFAPVAQLMGEAAAELLAPCERRWTHSHQLGVVAGSQPLGVGHLLARFEEDNDGTVAVSETRIPGATDHTVLSVSHLGLLLSARVAREVGTFLREGRFSRR